MEIENGIFVVVFGIRDRYWQCVAFSIFVLSKWRRYVLCVWNSGRELCNYLRWSYVSTSWIKSASTSESYRCLYWFILYIHSMNETMTTFFVFSTDHFECVCISFIWLNMQLSFYSIQFDAYSNWPVETVDCVVGWIQLNQSNYFAFAPHNLCRGLINWNWR